MTGPILPQGSPAVSFASPAESDRIVPMYRAIEEYVDGRTTIMTFTIEKGRVISHEERSLYTVRADTLITEGA